MSQCLSWNEVTKNQMEEMHKHRWIESEKARKDAGDAAFLDWVTKYAGLFRKHWCTNVCLFRDKCDWEIK